MSGGRLIPLAEVARAHGVRGELRLRVYNPESDLLLREREVIVRGTDGGERTVRVESARPAEGAVLMKLQGIEDRDAANLLRGSSVCVPRERLERPDEGEFYVCDIEGAKLVGPGGELGVVEELTSYPACDVLRVRLASSGLRVEIPLLDEYIERVDVDAHLVIVRAAAVELWS